MKTASKRLSYLCILILFILPACSPDLVIEMPPEDTGVPEPEVVEAAEPTEEAEEPPAAEVAGLEDLLVAGMAMKWFDDGYLVFVPKGEVTLGDNQYENNPEHTVFVEDYWIYMFKVTNGQYRHCMAAGACSSPAADDPYPDIDDPEIKDEPVIGVTWEQADAYCEWMNGRLPTRAEWEKAARGPEAYTYPWGEEDPDCDLLNYGECEDPAITKVFEYPDGRSYYQAFDLAGNTYEWAYDLYEYEIIARLPGEPEDGPPDGTERSVRGSGFTSTEELIPSAQLFYLEPENYRTDLGFRCVLQGAEPEAFASPCVQSAYVPGVPPEWHPGPQPGDDLPPDLDPGLCKTDIGTNYTQYCSNQTLQQGGLDLSIAAVGSTDVFVKSWGSPQAVACLEGNDPLPCFGPELAPVTFEICATCLTAIQGQSIDLYCDCSYSLEDTNPPTCVYNGSPPQQGQTCPAGFVYDQVNDICVSIVMQTGECQEGYQYHPDTQCCVATYTPPLSDPGTLPNAYQLCPPGYGDVSFAGGWVPQGQGYGVCLYILPGMEVENCITRTFNLGECRDIPKECKNPSQYTDENSCKAAGCKWDMPAVGGPYSCMYP